MELQCTRCKGKGYVPGGTDRYGDVVHYPCSACSWKGFIKGAKNTEQQVQPDNGQQVCTNKGCAGYSNGYCISFENCPVKAVSG